MRGVEYTGDGVGCHPTKEEHMRRKRTLISYAGLLTALTLVAAACGDSTSDQPPETVVVTSIVTETITETVTSIVTEIVEVEAMNPFEGTSVTVFGPESGGAEEAAMIAALDLFAASSGIEVTYLGARDFSDQINAQAAGGNPPDIAVFPQPGKIADFAREGFVVPLPADTEAVMNDNFSSAWTAFGNVDGVQYAIPTKADLKSLVWYQPARFDAAGYSIPETYDELLTLTDTMIADGNTPFCIGIESGGATGWTFTDWVEDLTLRMQGADYYDQWVDHSIPFNNPEMVAIWEEVLNLWNKPGAVFAASGSIAATAFGDNGQPLVDGKCFMHRQASFYSAFLPEGTPAADGSEGAVDVFYFPGIGDEKPVLGAGTLVSSFRDAPEVWAVMEYFASAAYADARQRFQALGKGGAVTEGVLSGFLSPNLGADLSLYTTLERSFLDILATADVVRFDGSDLMPSDVGAGTFWTEGTSAVNGDTTIQEALDAIEASWP